MGGDDLLGVIIDAVPAAVAYVDRERRYRLVNAKYRAWFGDVGGRSVEDVLGPELATRVRDHEQRALAGETITFESLFPCPDGRERWLQVEYTPDRGPGGGVRGYIATLQDVSDRKLIASRLALLAETSVALESAADQDATVLAIAQIAVPALADWAAVYLDRFGVLVPREIAHVSRLGEAETWQLARTFNPHLTMTAIVQGEHVVVPLVARGRRLGVLVLGNMTTRMTSDDLTLVEELGRRASAALALARSFEQQRRANERLQAADRRKDEFLAIVSHELRNPLSPIVTAIDLMEYRGHSGCERERAVIRRQALHMARLVDDLLDVARIRRGKFTLKQSATELRSIIVRAVELTSPLLEQRMHQLTVDVPHDLVVDADATRLTQVFANLLTNAAKYTQTRGHIGIAATVRDGTITVKVSDDGPGIEPDVLEVIFDAFVQSDRTLQRAEGGLGLGLSLVRSLTELHGGRVSAANHPSGRGAVFTIELPALAAIAEPPAPPRIAAPPSVNARLLVVDDNADAATALAALLREIGYDVAVAHDAPAALILADEFRPSIALLDIGLPVMDGYELARHLRARLAEPPRLVAVTGYGDRADLTRSRDAGFEVQLGKPVDFDRLVSVLGSLCPS